MKLDTFSTTESKNIYKNNLFTISALAFFGLVGILLVIYGTSKYGIGISPDSVAYISTARNIVKNIFGHGRFVQFDGQSYVFWPPLFPVALAILGFFGVDPLTGAKIVNATAFGLIVFFSGCLFLDNIISRRLVFLATLYTLISVTLLKVSVMAWSESLYILFSLIFFITLFQALKYQSLPLLVLSSFLASFASLQKYIGITLIITGLITMLFVEKQMLVRTKIKYALIFCFISVMPLFLWVIRNYFSTGTFTGYRFPAYYGLSENILLTLDVLTIWFLPTFFHAVLRYFVVTIFVVCFIISCISKFRTNRIQINNSWGIQRKSIVIYVITYTLLLIIGSSRFAADPINDRLLAPIFPLVTLILFTTIEDICYWFYSALHRWKTITVTIMILLFFLLFYPAVRTSLMISHWKAEGAGEDYYGTSNYGQRAWQESPSIKWLKHNPLKGQLYSNEPDALYILTGIVAKRIIRKEYISQFRNELILNKDCLLIWFEDTLNGQKRCLFRKDEVYPLEKLKEAFKLNEIISFSDGGIYQFNNVKGKSRKVE